jgi:hypothetical protein
MIPPTRLTIEPSAVLSSSDDFLDAGTEWPTLTLAETRAFGIYYGPQLVKLDLESLSLVIK